MRYLIVCLFTLSFLPLISQETIEATMSHDGLERTYRLRVPVDIVEDEKFPLIFNFHGFGSNGLEQEYYSDMNPVADTARFVVCYPNGIDNQWNVTSFGGNLDDVGFVDQLLDELIATYPIDENKVYSTGMSNGGYFSYKLACDLTERITAIASVTGSMAPSELEDCTPSRAIPVLQMHGTADPTVLINGSGFSASIEEVMDFWANHNTCDSEFSTYQIEDIDMEDETTIELLSYNSCPEDAPVLYYKVIGGAHTWPGALFVIGATSQDIHGSSEIWNFFKNFNLESETTPTSIVDGQSQDSMIEISFPEGNVLKWQALQTGIISLMDLQGRILYNGDEFHDSGLLSLYHYRKGMYFLIFKDQMGNQETNIIIIK